MASPQLRVLWRMSSMLLLLLICGPQRGSSMARAPAEPIGGAKSALGKLVNLPKADILDTLNSGQLLFDSKPESTTESYSQGDSNTQYFQNGNQFTRELAADAGLQISAASVSLSMETAFNMISGYQSEVSIAKAFAKSIVSKTYVDDDQLKKLPLRPDFLSSFQSLPITIQNEWLSSAWIPLGEFLETWGTHVITAAYTGATFESYSAASSSSQYSHRSLEARACFRAEGYSVAVRGCAGFSDAEKTNGSTLVAHDKRYAKGATAATRNRLLTQAVTPDMIEAFLNQAAADEQPVRYRFLPLWSLLRKRFQVRSDNWRRATNLEAYYDGWLGFGCKLVEMKANNLVEPAQWFRFDLNNAGYAKCLRRCLGCHSYYQDCFRWDNKCCCAGPSCLVPDGQHVRVEDDRHKGWADMGCTYENPESCVCGNANYEQGCNIQLDDNKYRQYVALWDNTPQTATSAGVLTPALG